MILSDLILLGNSLVKMVKVNRERQLWVLNCNTCGKEVISKIYCRSCFEGFCFDCVVFKQPHFSCPISSHVKGGIIGIQICCKCQCCRYLRRQCNYYHLCYADLLHLLTCESYVERRDDKEPSKIVNQLRRKRFGQWLSALTCPCRHQFNIYRNHDYSTTYIEYIALQLELGYSHWLVPPHPPDQVH